jgi:uncharacterized protein
MKQTMKPTRRFDAAATSSFRLSANSGDGAVRSPLDCHFPSEREKGNIDLVESQLLWVAAVGGLGLGLLLGYVLSRSGARREAAKLRELEEQLGRAEAEHAQYQAQVSQHFVETSRRLHDLTLQYKSVYEHLADGARRLCPDGAVAIAPSLAEAALPEEAGGLLAHDDDAQLDLDLDAPAWSSTGARDDDLGPLLEEDAPPAPSVPRAS